MVPPMILLLRGDSLPFFAMVSIWVEMRADGFYKKVRLGDGVERNISSFFKCQLQSSLAFVNQQVVDGELGAIGKLGTTAGRPGGGVGRPVVENPVRRWGE